MSGAMSKAGKEVIYAFLNMASKTNRHDSTDGKCLMYRGNCIAEHRDDGLWISMAGWPTVTTRDRLNTLGSMVRPWFTVYQKDHVQYLEGGFSALGEVTIEMDPVRFHRVLSYEGV